MQTKKSPHQKSPDLTQKLFGQVEKFQKSNKELYNEFKRIADEEERKIELMKEAANLKSQKIRSEISKISHEIGEMTETYQILKMRCKNVQEKWRKKEENYLKKCDELDQKLIIINAKGNEVLSRIRTMMMREIGERSFDINSFSYIPPLFTLGQSSLFAPTAAELESQLPTMSFDLFETLPEVKYEHRSRGKIPLSKEKDKKEKNCTNKKIEEKKMALEILQKECRELQQKRDKLSKIKEAIAFSSDENLLE